MSLLQRVKNFFDPQYLVKKDLIRGEIPGRREAYSSFVKIAMPAVIEMVLISLISAADTAMVGTVGDAAIAAVGITSQPMMILLSIFFALNIGVTAVVARRKGEERQDDANTVMRMALCICVLLGIVMTLIAVFFAEELMVFAGAKPEIIGDAVAYFRIVTSVLALRALTMAITAAQRGAGNTKITMRINTTANIVNVCLNFLLIGGNFGCPALGVVCVKKSMKAYVNGIGAAFVTAQNMVMEAYSLGVSSCIVGRAEATFEKPEMQALLQQWQLDEAYTPLVFVCLGYIDGEYPAAKPRSEGRIRFIR